VFWKLAFPIGSLTKPELRFTELLEPDAQGVVDVTALPFFKEALPFFPLSILAEILLGFARGKSHYYKFDDTLTSLMAGLVNRMSNLLLQAVLAVPYGYVWTHYRLIDTPDTFSTFFIALIVTDLLYYFYHRMTHEVGLLWNSHSVHHSSNEYNLACALRQTMTPFDSVLFYIPMALLVPPRVKVVHGAFSLLYQYWVHTRHVPKLWWPLEFVLSTPSHHRVHHARNPAYAAGGGRNYGGVLIIWDRMFGTFAEERVGDGFAMPNDSRMAAKLEAATGESFQTRNGDSSKLLKDAADCDSQDGAAQIEAEPPVYGLIPPLDSKDAIYAQTYHWYEMGRRMLTSPSIMDALAVPSSTVGWYLVKATPKTREAWEQSEKEEAEAETVGEGVTRSTRSSVPAAGLAVDRPRYRPAASEAGRPKDQATLVWKDIPVPSIGTRYNPVLEGTAPLGWAVVLHSAVHFGMVTGAFYASELVASLTSGAGRTAVLVAYVFLGLFGVGSLLDRRTLVPVYEAVRCTLVAGSILLVALAASQGSADLSSTGFHEIADVVSRGIGRVSSHPGGATSAIVDAVSSMGGLSGFLFWLHVTSAAFAAVVLPGAISWARKVEE